MNVVRNTLFCLAILAFSLVAGCQEERVPAPNEKSAAPARLPGEDPHAHTPTQTEKTRK